MKQFSNYDEAKASAKYSGSTRLPAGGYVCRILKVDYTAGKDGYSDFIKIMFDISEGEYKDFFKKAYNAADAGKQKWKGNATIWVPRDDGSEKDGWTKNKFASWTNSLESANDNYVWDWDEKKWKGKTVGIVFGDTGTVIEGDEVVYTEARRGEDIKKIRDGSFRKEKFRKKNGYTGKAKSSDDDKFISVPEGKEVDLPF